MTKSTVLSARLKRRNRIKKRVRGSQERPRMSVFRSGKNIFVQIIDDTSGRVLASASSLTKAFKEQSSRGSNKEGAKIVGEMIAERAREKSIEKVVFDRNGNLFHGRVKALADAARAKGLSF